MNKGVLQFCFPAFLPLFLWTGWSDVHSDDGSDGLQLAGGEPATNDGPNVVYATWLITLLLFLIGFSGWVMFPAVAFISGGLATQYFSRRSDRRGIVNV